MKKMPSSLPTSICPDSMAETLKSLVPDGYAIRDRRVGLGKGPCPGSREAAGIFDAVLENKPGAMFANNDKKVELSGKRRNI